MTRRTHLGPHTEVTELHPCPNLRDTHRPSLPRCFNMPPLRKMDRRRSEQEPMTEIKLSAVSSPSLPRQSQESFLEPPPSSHPIYGNYRETDPAVEQYGRLARRPGVSDLHNRTLSDLMTESIPDSNLDTPTVHGSYPSFAPGAHSSYSGSQTRSSSPYPSPSPFVS